ncbi:carbonic anhydrase [Calycomorphotria hydatis]|uniref:Carbonic anhydrase n=1 Tax=Calycomorphotria hydatis TaxID=2528027 RepID=A0A517T8K9_9PLAN|nr:carbonic anhydrase [Calycomorphotria hydatis]QDT64705.1 Carbonic anhydrase 1 [Calycomorphotria hydatis]
MQKLVDGIHKFQQEAFNQDKELFATLANGQSPQVLLITCSDSRIDPNYLTQTKPGDLFVLRTAGNIVPAFGSVFAGEAATIEYAVTGLKVSDIVICGHSQCGAIGGLLKPEALETMPSVKAYLEYAQSTKRIMDENHADVTDAAERLNLAVETNVLVQLESLRTHPSVAAAVDRGDLELHGWVYKFETGEVFSHNATQNKFLPLDDVSVA